jgi:hypothetical protein
MEAGCAADCEGPDRRQAVKRKAAQGTREVERAPRGRLGTVPAARPERHAARGAAAAFFQASSPEAAQPACIDDPRPSTPMPAADNTDTDPASAAGCKPWAVGCDP